MAWNHWNVITKELPRLKLKEGLIKICCDMCRTKPQTTYDNAVGHLRERYADGYTLVGHRSIETVD